MMGYGEVLSLYDTNMMIPGSRLPQQGCGQVVCSSPFKASWIFANIFIATTAVPRAT